MFELFRKGSLDYSLATSLGNSRYELETAKDIMRIHGRLFESAGTDWI